MTTNQIIGAAILFGLFFSLFWAIARVVGFWFTLSMFLGASAFAHLFHLGVDMLSGRMG